MKKILLSVLACFVVLGLSAQDQDSGTKKNLVKINVTSLLLKTYSFQFERAIARKTSVALGIRTMPESSLPFKSQFISLVDDPEAEKQIDNFRTGNFAITPEIRFYMGKKEAPAGFYFAPFVRFTTFTAKMPFDFDVNGTTETIPLSGDLKTVTGGFLLGAQWNLGKALSLDWWILGPQYGSSNGKIEGKKSLSTQEQQELRTELEDLDIPLVKSTTTVDANGARVDFKGPWAGLRAGLSLGIRF